MDRYSICAEGLGEINIDLDDEGNWVDYEEVKQEFTRLRAEIERLEQEREEIIRSRDMYHDLSSLLQAEIERKDEALRKISDHVDVRLELYKNNREALYGLQSIAEQALQNKEASDEDSCTM